MVKTNWNENGPVNYCPYLSIYSLLLPCFVFVFLKLNNTSFCPFIYLIISTNLCLLSPEIIRDGRRYLVEIIDLTSIIL